MKTATIKAYYEICDPFGTPIEITFVTALSDNEGKWQEEFKINFRDEKLKKILEQGSDNFKENLIANVREEMQPLYTEWVKKNNIKSENKELTSPEEIEKEFGEVTIKL